MALSTTRTTYDTLGALGYSAASDGPVTAFAIQCDATSLNPGLCTVSCVNSNGTSKSFTVAIAVDTTEYIKFTTSVVSLTLKGSGGDAIMSYWPVVI